MMYVNPPCLYQCVRLRYVRTGVQWDFPLIVDWLKKCKKHIECGRDNHEYSKLVPMFNANGCTRIDDVPRMTTELIWELAAAAGVIVMIGLVNRVHQYVMEDVAHLKKYGQLI